MVGNASPLRSTDIQRYTEWYRNSGRDDMTETTLASEEWDAVQAAINDREMTDE
jgi:hypothetical protein